MSKVKFNVNTEYMYLSNFKVLQSKRPPRPQPARQPLTNPPKDTFARHQIDHPIPVQQLIKCKMQDNLEFLQWTKRYWDQHFPGIDYDPQGRRKASGAPTSIGSSAPVSSGFSTSGLRTTGASRATAGSAAGTRRPVASNSAAARAPRPGSAAGGAAAAALQAENGQLKETVEGLERERDFYFQKLRDIEVMLQQEVESNPALEQEEGGMIPRLQAVLYSTEEGFEIPDEGADGVEPAEEETF